MDEDRWPLTRKAIKAGELSPLALLASMPDSGIRQLRPGVWYAGDPEAAEEMLAEHDEFVRRTFGDAEDD